MGSESLTSVGWCLQPIRQLADGCKCWFRNDSKRNNFKNCITTCFRFITNTFFVVNHGSLTARPCPLLCRVLWAERNTSPTEPCLYSSQMKKWCSISSSNPFYPIAEFNYSNRWVSKLQPSMITVQRSEHCQALCWISRTRLRPYKSIEQSILSKARSWPGLLAL